ncbi:MAG: hypothetical protein ACLP8S_20150 [Solirubrobacteraceae bacterium]
MFATGYRADLARVPYLAGLLKLIAIVDGFPVLNASFAKCLGRGSKGDSASIRAL